jgi:class 3 adenylate cyclase
MHCPQCGTESPEGARFCFECGAKLAVACLQCGATLPPQARFCPQCGTKLTAAPEIAPAAPDDRLQRLVPKEFAERLLATRGQVSRERRVVTILMSDVKGSTAMAEGLDPEDVMEVMDGAFDVLIEPITRYEGTLARLEGDAILAFFGAPIAHEDDAERACRAGLEIVKGAHEYARRLERERGITGFDVRVGVNTGLVVVGEVGSDLRVEYTAMGDAINLAARLESAAEPGTVLITEATLKLVAPLFETEALGPVQVKGRAEPVAVYRVHAAMPTVTKLRGIAGLESELVGREAEFAALQEVIDRLEVGVGGIVTVMGEAGIGKSRLVAELQKEVGTPDRAPLQWVEGRCLSYGTSIAYLLWLDVLRGLLGVTIEDAPVAVRDALRTLVRSLCDDAFEDVYPLCIHVQPGAARPCGSYLKSVLNPAFTVAAEGIVERCQPPSLGLKDHLLDGWGYFYPFTMCWGSHKPEKVVLLPALPELLLHIEFPFLDVCRFLEHFSLFL